MNIYYVYIYYKPNNMEPFYVGYGKNNRKYYHLNEAIKNPEQKRGEHKLNIIRKILKNNETPIIEVLKENLSREEACKLEVTLISEIGRIDLGTGPLANKTQGGDGVVDWSDEMRKQASKRCNGYTVYKNLETGEKLKLHKDDKLLENENIVGINYGLQGVSNPNGQLDGYILAKDPVTGEVFRVKSDDSRWESGELVGFNRGIECHENTRIAASKKWKGVPKNKEHNQKNSDAMKKLKWYCNFETGKVGRFIENENPDGYVRVSGPHKLLTMEECEKENLDRKNQKSVQRELLRDIRRKNNSIAQKKLWFDNPLRGLSNNDIHFIIKIVKIFQDIDLSLLPNKNSTGKKISIERSFANEYHKKFDVSHHKIFSIVNGKKNRILRELLSSGNFLGYEKTVESILEK